MENVRDWISDNPEIFSGICTVLLIIAFVIIAVFQIASYVAFAVVVIALLGTFVRVIYTFILALVEEFLC